MKQWIKDNCFTCLTLSYCALIDSDNQPTMNHKEALDYFKNHILYVCMTCEQNTCSVVKLRWFERKQVPAGVLSHDMIVSDILAQFIISKNDDTSTFLYKLPVLSFNQMKIFIEGGIKMLNYRME